MHVGQAFSELSVFVLQAIKFVLHFENSLACLTEISFESEQIRLLLWILGARDQNLYNVGRAFKKLRCRRGRGWRSVLRSWAGKDEQDRRGGRTDETPQQTTHRQHPSRGGFRR